MKHAPGIPLLLVLACLVAAATSAWGARKVTTLDTVKPLRPGAASVESSAKWVMCHRPPGNPHNTQVIFVGEGAVSKHLELGDTLGNCSLPCPVPGSVPNADQTSTYEPCGDGAPSTGNRRR